MVFANYISGTTWYGGEGSQDVMMEKAREGNHKAHIASIDPRSGYQNYASYQDWPTAIKHLKSLGHLIKHHFELIPESTPCKPYFDFDYTYSVKEEGKEDYETEEEDTEEESTDEEEKRKTVPRGKYKAR